MTERDYKSFSSAAKSRFRCLTKELGYEQISGILYAKNCGEWMQVIGLQASSYGNPFFYVNYGIGIPQLWPNEEPKPIKELGLVIANRLGCNGEGAFPCGSKLEIEQSAQQLVIEYQKQALPWLKTLCSWDAIANAYFKTTSLKPSKLGSHRYDYGEHNRAAYYGRMLMKAGDLSNALIWLNEAKRILLQTRYITRSGCTVYEPQKNAKLQTLTDNEKTRLTALETLIRECE